MSWGPVLAVIKASREPGRFSDAEMRVLINLAEHHNGKTGQCDPGLALLGAEADKERGHLRRILGELERGGEIARADPSSKGGKGHRQQYHLLLKGDWQPPFADAERVTGNTAKGDPEGPQRVTGQRADLRRRATTRNITRKEPRERAGSTPNGAGRARVPDPEPLTAVVSKAGVPAEIKAAWRAAVTPREKPPLPPPDPPCKDCPTEATG